MVLGKEVIYLRYDVILGLFSKDIHDILIVLGFVYKMFENTNVWRKSASCWDQKIVFGVWTDCIMSNGSLYKNLLTKGYFLCQEVRHPTFWRFFYNDSDLFFVLHVFSGACDAIRFFNYCSCNLSLDHHKLPLQKWKAILYLKNHIRNKSWGRIIFFVQCCYSWNHVYTIDVRSSVARLMFMEWLSNPIKSCRIIRNSI